MRSYEGCRSFITLLIIVEADPSEIGGGSKSYLFVAVSYTRASAASLSETSLCPGIQYRWLVLCISASVERIVLNV